MVYHFPIGYLMCLNSWRCTWAFLVQMLIHLVSTVYTSLNNGIMSYLLWISNILHYFSHFSFKIYLQSGILSVMLHDIPIEIFPWFPLQFVYNYSISQMIILELFSLFPTIPDSVITIVAVCQSVWKPHLIYLFIIFVLNIFTKWQTSIYSVE